MGAPSKKDKMRTAIILDAVSKTGSVKIASNYAKVAENTVRNWMRDDKSFCVAVEYAKATFAMSLMERVKDKDPWKLLKNTYPKEYVDHPEGIDINIYSRPLKDKDSQELMKEYLEKLAV